MTTPTSTARWRRRSRWSGERWTLLIIRDVFMGIRRFEELQRDLGIARNILQARLERLVEEGSS